MDFLYKSFVRRLFFQFEPEMAHCIAVALLKWIDNSYIFKNAIRLLFQNESGPVNIFGLNFPNKIGLAAGFDKDGHFPSTASALGFGHVEVGTVTPRPQEGNPKPRLFRLSKEESLVNKMGFNNEGAESMRKRIKKFYPKGERHSPLGINIGKAKETPLEESIKDYTESFNALAEIADYFTLNISSPNTENLRKLQHEDNLRPLLQDIDRVNSNWAKKNKTTKIPCLIKISPDESFSRLEKLIETVLESNIDGIIATNTTSKRPNCIGKDLDGGLSGKSMEALSLETIKFISKLTYGKLPIIGVGGVHNTESLNRKLDSGACMVQLYTAFIYEGPFLASKLAKSLKNHNSWLT